MKDSTGLTEGCVAVYVLCWVNCPSLFCFLRFGRFVTDISVWIVLLFYICCLFSCSEDIWTGNRSEDNSLRSKDVAGLKVIKVFVSTWCCFCYC